MEGLGWKTWSPSLSKIPSLLDSLTKANLCFSSSSVEWPQEGKFFLIKGQNQSAVSETLKQKIGQCIMCKENSDIVDIPLS
jgi:hypothetical protein